MNEPRKSRIAFGTRHLLMLVTFVAVVSAWWVDRHRLQRQVHRSDRENIASQHRALEAHEQLSALRISARSEEESLKNLLRLQRSFIEHHRELMSDFIEQSEDSKLIGHFEGSMRQFDLFNDDFKRISRISE